MRQRLRVAVLALGLALGATAHAQQSPLAGPPQWLQQLDLSEAQQDEVFRIFYEQAPAIRSRIQAARRVHEELEKLAVAARLDTPLAAELTRAQAQALADVAEIRIQGMVRAFALLTPEQRAEAMRLQSSASE